MPSEIEQLIESDAIRTAPDYSGQVLTEEEIEQGAHREFVGGYRQWDLHGQRQLEFLVAQGLRPDHLLLDVGCGSFRAGRHFVDFLEPEHYYGVDANHSVVLAGYDRELSDEQRRRLPTSHLRINDRFNVDFGVGFDYAIANSVFSHVSLNHIRLALYRLSAVMAPGGKIWPAMRKPGRQRSRSNSPSCAVSLPP